MNDEDREQVIERVMAGVDLEKARLAAELIKQGWPLSRVREHLDLLDNTKAEPIKQPTQVSLPSKVQSVEESQIQMASSPSPEKSNLAAEPEHAAVPR